MLVFAAWLALAQTAKPITVAFPLDYYSAGEVAKALSGHGVKYVASPKLNADYYVISLPDAPVEGQLKLLCRGLGWEAESSGTSRAISPDRKQAKEDERLKNRIVDNLVDEYVEESKTLVNVANGDDPPVLPHPSADLLRFQQQQMNTVRTDLSMRILVDILSDAAPPNASNLEESGDDTAYYPRSTLSNRLRGNYDSYLRNPPLLGMIFGYQVASLRGGPKVIRRVSPIVASGAESPPNDLKFSVPGPDDRKSIVDSYLKGSVGDPIWKNPGLLKKDRDSLADREAKTEKAVSAFDEITVSDKSLFRNNFSSVLGQIARVAKVGLLYKVNPNDERTVTPISAHATIGLRGILGSGAGYTAKVEDGVLEVKDELDVLPTSETVPEVALVEALHQKVQGKSILDDDGSSGFFPLFATDIERINARRNLIDGRTGWPRMLGISLAYTDEDVLRIKSGPFVIPVLRLLPDESLRSLARGETVKITDPAFLSNINIPLADMLYDLTIGFSKAEEATFLNRSRIESISITLSHQSDDLYQAKMYFEVRSHSTPLYWLTFVGLTNLDSHDPFLKSLIGS